MQKYIDTFLNSQLFSNMSKEDIFSILPCLNLRTKKFKKGELIICAGDISNYVCMLLEGEAIIQKEDFWGDVSIIAKLSKSMIFAESYAMLKNIPIEVSVLAYEDSIVAFLDIKNIYSSCSKSCSFHNQLIQNLLYIISNKNFALTKKIEYISKKNIRDRLLSYLSSEAMKNGSDKFTIEFNRQQLADYLCVNRSALSNEISKLIKEEIIDAHKNTFILKNLYHNPH